MHDLGDILDVIIIRSKLAHPVVELSTSISLTVVSSSGHLTSNRHHQSMRRRHGACGAVSMWKFLDPPSESRTYAMPTSSLHSQTLAIWLECNFTIVNIPARLALITQVTRRTRRSDLWFNDDWGHVRPKKIPVLFVTHPFLFLDAFPNIFIGFLKNKFLFTKFIYFFKVNFRAVLFTNNVHNSTFEVQCQIETSTTSVMNKNLIVYCENHLMPNLILFIYILLCI